MSWQTHTKISKQLLEGNDCRLCSVWQSFPASGRPSGKTTKTVLRSVRSGDTGSLLWDVSDVPGSVFRLFRKFLGSRDRGRPVRKEPLFEPYLKLQRKDQIFLMRNKKNHLMAIVWKQTERHTSVDRDGQEDLPTEWSYNIHGPFKFKQTER